MTYTLTQKPAGRDPGGRGRDEDMAIHTFEPRRDYILERPLSARAIIDEPSGTAGAIARTLPRGTRFFVYSDPNPAGRVMITTFDPDRPDGGEWLYVVAFSDLQAAAGALRA